MPFVLREGFAEGGSDLSAARGAPAAAAFEVLVDAVLLQEPVALTGMASEHFPILRSKVVFRDRVLGEMPDQVGENSIATNLEDRAVSFLAAESEHQLSRVKREMIVFESEWPTIGIFGKLANGFLKTVQPSNGLLGGTVLRPPQRRVVELQLRARGQRDDPFHVRHPKRRRTSSNA